MPTIGPIISRASAGMVSRCARFICSATGLTRRFHIGMVSTSQSSAFHVRGWAFAEGSVVASSSQRSARRTDSSTAVRSPAETAALSPTCWRAMRSAISKFTDSPSVRAFIVEPMPESICPNWFKISPKPPWPPPTLPPNPNAANGLFCWLRRSSSPLSPSLSLLGKVNPNPLLIGTTLQSCAQVVSAASWKIATLWANI